MNEPSEDEQIENKVRRALKSWYNSAKGHE